MTHPVIQTRDLRKTYELAEPVHALRGVNLTVQPGEFVSIMGQSGSGKSTLMNILGCLDRPTSGTFELDGIDVAKLNRDEMAGVRNRKIGFIFQGFNLLSRTSAIENVALPLVYARDVSPVDSQERAAEALKRVGLGERMDHHPAQLSGGQQQRVAIARALVNSPALVLADEPTGNLDSRTTMDILSLFQELHRQGITIVVVTHEPDVARYTQRIVELKDGSIIRDEAIRQPRDARADLEQLKGDTGV